MSVNHFPLPLSSPCQPTHALLPSLLIPLTSVLPFTFYSLHPSHMPLPLLAFFSERPLCHPSLSSLSSVVIHAHTPIPLLLYTFLRQCYPQSLTQFNLPYLPIHCPAVLCLALPCATLNLTASLNPTLPYPIYSSQI